MNSPGSSNYQNLSRTCPKMDPADLLNARSSPEGMDFRMWVVKREGGGYDSFKVSDGNTRPPSQAPSPNSLKLQFPNMPPPPKDGGSRRWSWPTYKNFAFSCKDGVILVAYNPIANDYIGKPDAHADFQFRSSSVETVFPKTVAELNSHMMAIISGGDFELCGKLMSNLKEKCVHFDNENNSRISVSKASELMNDILSSYYNVGFMGLIAGCSQLGTVELHCLDSKEPRERTKFSCQFEFDEAINHLNEGDYYDKSVDAEIWYRLFFLVLKRTSPCTMLELMDGRSFRGFLHLIRYWRLF